MDKEEILKLIGKECDSTEYNEKAMIVGYSTSIYNKYYMIIGFYKENSGDINNFRWDIFHDEDTLVIKSPMFKSYCLADNYDIENIQ